MDHARRQCRGEVMDHADEGIDKKLSLSVEGIAIIAVAGGRLGEGTCVSREDETSQQMDNDPGSNKELQEEREEVMVLDMRDQPKISDTLCGVDQRTSYNSGHLVNEGIREAVVVIDSAETEYVNRDNRELEAKVNESALSKVSLEAPKTDNNSCVRIDINCGSCNGFNENLDGERTCRICHLASGQPSDAMAINSINGAIDVDLIQLGCACKDELGIAHSHCAEAWFKLKGNRICEICGETAKNVLGVTDDGFMEEWNERRFTDIGTTSSSPGMFDGCWRGQPFCNFLMACLVIAFVLPWFFRVNMFV